MATNGLNDGKTMTIAAPSGGLVSGAGVLTGARFGVALTTAAQGVSLAVSVTGTHELPKVSANTFAIGAKVYWDNTNKNCTSTASGNTLIGTAYEAGADGDTTLKVLLGIVA